MTTRRWRHKKRGSSYTEVGRATLQASVKLVSEGGILFAYEPGSGWERVASNPISEGAVLVIYRDDTGRLWAREQGEFEDGRFEEVVDG